MSCKIAWWWMHKPHLRLLGNIGSGNGMLLRGSKRLAEPMMTMNYDAI